MVAGLTLIGWVQSIIPSSTQEVLVSLDLVQELNEAEELAVVYVIATCLKYIWEQRMLKKVAKPFLMRAELEAKISLLRKTRYVEAGNIMEVMLGNLGE